MLKVLKNTVAFKSQNQRKPAPREVLEESALHNWRTVLQTRSKYTQGPESIQAERSSAAK